MPLRNKPKEDHSEDLVLTPLNKDIAKSACYDSQEQFSLQDISRPAHSSSVSHSANKKSALLKSVLVGFLLLVGGLGSYLIVRRVNQNKQGMPVGNPDIDSHPNPDTRDDVSISYIEQEYQNGVNDVCHMPEAASLCENNLGIPRKSMPQMTHAVAKKFYEARKKQGIRVESMVLLPDQLLPVQNEIIAEKIVDMYNLYQLGAYDPCLHQITVSVHNGENRIIDGHHRAVTCRFTDKKRQQVMAIEDSVTNILEDLKHFDGVTYASASRNLFFSQPSAFIPPEDSSDILDSQQGQERESRAGRLDCA